MRGIGRLVLLLGLVCASSAGLVSAVLAADKYPVRPVHFVVGFAAGGPNDIVARVFGDWLSTHLGQQIVIENRAGSGGMLAANAVINSPPDGYTIMFVAPNNAIGTTLYKNLPFVFLRDTTSIAGMMRLTNVMVVPPSLPVRTVAEFIAHAKANPGKLSYASSGNGTSVHMSAELFKLMAGLDMVHVPYRGSSAAYPDLMTGKVHVLFDNLPGSVEFVRSGKLRALGVTTALALGCAAGGSGDRRDGGGLRGQHLLRRFRAQGHAARRRRDAEQGVHGGARRSENAGAHRRARWHADADVARRVRQARRRRD